MKLRLVNHLDGIAPRRAGLRQPVGGIISGPALHLPQQPLIAGQVKETRVPPVREEHVLAGIRIGPPARPAAAMLINSQVRHQRRRLPQHRISLPGERLVHHRPGQPAFACRLRDCPPPAGDQAARMLTQPGSDPAPRRDLHEGLGERLPRARRLPALQPPLHPHHGDLVLAMAKIRRPRRHIPLHPPGHRPAARARRRLPVRRHHPDRPAAAGLRIHLSDLHAIQREQPRRHILTHVPVAPGDHDSLERTMITRTTGTLTDRRAATCQAAPLSDSQP